MITPSQIVTAGFLGCQLLPELLLVIFCYRLVRKRSFLRLCFRQGQRLKGPTC